jgi:predicted RecA/RadA family phage recombinase
VEAIASATITTTLANATLPADTTITLANGTGIAVGDALKVGSPVAENAVVKTIVGNTVTLSSGLSAFHNAGEDVVRTGGKITYQDSELSQDSCAAGRRLAFAKSSEPVVSGEIAPYASGLSPEGKLVGAATAKPRFYGQPLVAWQPLAGADQYEVQWSTKGYPWKTVGTQLTWGTSLTLPLSPGTWYYRVRGLDFLMTGSKPQMSWSDPVRLVVTKPRFRVVH